MVQEGAHFLVRLDGRPMRLPGGPILALASARLAEAIADEWQRAGGAKGGRLSEADVPLTRLAGTAQARVAPDAGPTIDALARYAEADLLCYRATGPQALCDRQDRLWQPWLDWAERTYAAPLLVVRGVVHAAQPGRSLALLRAALAAKPAGVLAGLGVLVPATGSLVLGLAVAEGALGPSEAHELAVLDEVFQAETWGEDEEALHRRRNLAADIYSAELFISLSETEQAVLF